jgi:hypothetical protein
MSVTLRAVSENRHHRNRRALGVSGLLASWVLALVLVVVPAALPLCGMEMDLCSMEVAAVPTGTHCPMEEAGRPEMPCCVQDTSPQGPAPATPGKADADLRVQLKAQAPAPTLVQTLFATPTVEAPAPAPVAILATPAVPLYTLLSTLLS